MACGCAKTARRSTQATAASPTIGSNSMVRPRPFGVCSYGTGPYSRYGPDWRPAGACEPGTWQTPWWAADDGTQPIMATRLA
jgi:hypothetical protein